MDWIDASQDEQERFREEALRKHLRKLNAYLGDDRSPGLHPSGAGPGQRRVCRDCGADIEPARLAVMPFAVRCAECQALKERRERP